LKTMTRLKDAYFPSLLSQYEKPIMRPFLKYELFEVIQERFLVVSLIKSDIKRGKKWARL